jgi:hypothetical protein
MTALLLLLGSFMLYLVTLSGTVPAYRDSGDMISAVWTLGIAHPPGYPLYVTAGKLFSDILPLANAAYRVNVFSAVCMAGSVVGLYGVVKSLTRNRGIALAAAVLYAVSPAVVSLARVAEMYSLAALFASGIIACYIVNTPRSLLLGSFLVGLGFGVHPTLLFLGFLFIPKLSSPAGSYSSFPAVSGGESIKDMMDPRPVTAGDDGKKAAAGNDGWLRQGIWRLGFFLLGFSVVGLLFFRAGTDPVQNWGNPSTLADLWRLITRSNYGGLKLHPTESHFSWTSAGVAEQTMYFVKALFRQWGWIGVLPGVLGLFVSFRRYKALAVSGVVAGPLFFILSNLPLEDVTTGPILQPYLVLVNLIWGVWAAAGLQSLLSRTSNAVVQGMLLAVLMCPALFRAAHAFSSNRDHFYAYDLARNMARTLPANAVIYDPDDPISFTLRTLQLTEGRRPDLVLLNFFRTYWGYRQIMRRWPDLLPPGPLNSAQELERLFWTYSMHRRPFYADLPVKVPAPMSYRSEGLLYPISSAAAPMEPPQLVRSRRFFEFYVWRGVWRTVDHGDFFTRQVLNYPAAAWCNLGMKYAERGEWAAAQMCYYRALCIDPRLSAAYNNLGVVDFEQRRYDRAVRNYEWALRYDPGNEGYRRNLELSKTIPQRSDR